MSGKNKLCKKHLQTTRRESCGYIPGKGGFIPKENRERRKAYRLLKKHGFCCEIRSKLRDWKTSKIKQFIKANHG